MNTFNATWKRRIPHATNEKKVEVKCPACGHTEWYAIRKPVYVGCMGKKCSVVMLVSPNGHVQLVPPRRQ